jgi:hypothetical protein
VVLRLVVGSSAAEPLSSLHAPARSTAISAMPRAPLRPSPALTSATISAPISPSTAVKGARSAAAV